LKILYDCLALFSVGNQRHGEHVVLVVPDPGRIDC